jgi:hypothetical protein
MVQSVSGHVGDPTSQLVTVYDYVTQPVVSVEALLMNIAEVRILIVCWSPY